MRSYFTALLGLGSIAYAAINQKCQGSLCYSLSIPDATAQSGKGDIFFQIKGPTSNSWIALGQGSSMSGSNIFVIYTSSNGKNVTLSPRTGTGHSVPSPNRNAQVSLLEGSGVFDGTMIANVKCSNCDSWSGGSMDFKGSSNSWIYATRSGSPLNTDDTGASLLQHTSTYDRIQFDFAQAKGGSQANPFSSSGTGTSSGSNPTSTSKACRSKNGNSSPGSGSGSGSGSNSGSGSGSGSATESASSTGGRSWPPRPTGSGYPWGNNGGYSSSYRRLAARDDDDEDCEDSSNGGNSSGLSSGGARITTTVLIAHGVMACLAFAILFPAGGIMIRVLSTPGIWKAHAAVQTIAYLVYIGAFGLGIYIANAGNYLNEYHPIIGIVLFILIFFQPFLGYVHHKQYMKYQSRTFWSYAHLWLGRIVITLGIVNGGLGFKLAGNSKTGMIVYSIVAGVVWLTYVACIFIGERKRKLAGANAPPKYSASSNGGSSPPGSHRAQMEYYGQHNRRP